MKRLFLHLAILAGLGAAGAALVVGGGLYNVSAQQGHLPVISWLMHTTYRNSVRLRAPSSDQVPDDLPNPDRIALGAAHYETACRFCHALPGENQSATVLAMTPHPPHITEAVQGWEPRHLFWIVKNGVKMTGMPGWPSDGRDDDVWNVVAFLNALGGIGEKRHNDPLGGIGAVVPIRTEARAVCDSCHAADGAGRGNAHIPRLDTQTQTYLQSALRAYRAGNRQSGIMQHAASRLSDAEIQAFARHYAVRSAAPRAAASIDPDRVETGRRLASGAEDAKAVAACNACHGPWPQKRSPDFPSLAGNRQAYLLQQLRLWKSGRRGGGPRAHLMHKVAPALDEGQMLALAAYYASLGNVGRDGR